MGAGGATTALLHEFRGGGFCGPLRFKWLGHGVCWVSSHTCGAEAAGALAYAAARVVPGAPVGAGSPRRVRRRLGCACLASGLPWLVSRHRGCTDVGNLLGLGPPLAPMHSHSVSFRTSVVIPFRHAARQAICPAMLGALSLSVKRCPGGPPPPAPAPGSPLLPAVQQRQAGIRKEYEALDTVWFMAGGWTGGGGAESAAGSAGLGVTRMAGNREVPVCGKACVPAMAPWGHWGPCQ